MLFLLVRRGACDVGWRVNDMLRFLVETVSRRFGCWRFGGSDFVAEL